ncbi:MAG: GNAT family N-acetyltransferase [Gaiellaceae bacterium]
MPRSRPLDATAPEEQIDAIAGEWDELADRAGAEPWARPGWARAWWSAFGGDAPFELVSVRREGRLTGVVPLVRGRGGWRAAANWHTPTFSLLAEDDTARAALVDELLRRRPAWVALPFLDPDEVEPALAAAARRRYRTLVRTLVRSPYVPTQGVVDDLWNGELDIKKRPKELTRRRRKLNEAGTVEVVVSDGSGGLDELLAEGLPVEASGWKAEEGTAIVSRPDTLFFYTEIARWAATRGILRLFFFRLDGRMISFELCLEDNNRLCNLKGGIDPDARGYAVGVLTGFEMIKYAFEHGLESFEFLGDEAPHKREWTQLVRERALVQLFRPDPVGATAHGAYAYGRPLVKRALARRQS